MLNGIHVVPPTDGEVIKITKEKVNRSPLPGYTLWGNGKTTRGGTSMDVLDIMKQLGKPEMTLLGFLRDEMANNSSNGSKTPSIVRPSESAMYSEYYKVAMKKHYAHMECLGILKRIKRGAYMLNPYLLIPYRYIDEMKDMWNALDRSQCDEDK